MYTIVVADDEEELRRAIIRKIDWESTGFRVVGEAENGIEALELVERMEQVGGLRPPNGPRQRDAPEQSGMTMK